MFLISHSSASESSEVKHKKSLITIYYKINSLLMDAHIIFLPCIIITGVPPYTRGFGFRYLPHILTPRITRPISYGSVGVRFQKF